MSCGEFCRMQRNTVSVCLVCCAVLMASHCCFIFAFVLFVLATCACKSAWICKTSRWIFDDGTLVSMVMAMVMVMVRRTGIIDGRWWCVRYSDGVGASNMLALLQWQQNIYLLFSVSFFVFFFLGRNKNKSKNQMGVIQ